MTADLRRRLRMMLFTGNGRLAQRFVWISFMMHVYDGFSARDWSLPTGRRPGYVHPHPIPR
jgi:hypothetical protein